MLIYLLYSSTQDDDSVEDLVYVGTSSSLATGMMYQLRKAGRSASIDVWNKGRLLVKGSRSRSRSPERGT